MSARGCRRAGYRVTDVARRADLEALVAHADERFGRLDAIVDNAGIGPISRFDALRVEDWDAMIDVNPHGTLYGIAAARRGCRQHCHPPDRAGLIQKHADQAVGMWERDR